MSDKAPIVFRYTPHNEGDFIKGIPPRDLTQSDVDRIHPNVRNDAFAVHPLYGKPLYTATEHGEALMAEQAKAAAEHDARLEEAANATLAEQPKWYIAKLEKIAARGDGTILPARNPGETQREYEARVDDDGNATLDSDGTPVNQLGTRIEGFVTEGSTPVDGETDKEGDA